MNLEQYRELLRSSDICLSIPIERCQETLELLVEKMISEQNPYLKFFYSARAQRLLHSMTEQMPEIKSYFYNQGNPVILALLSEPLEKYELSLRSN